MFYISAYIEARRDDDWTGWCRFFLVAIRSQAEDELTKAQEIIDLYNTLKSRVITLTRSQYAICALDWAFKQSIFWSTDFVVRSDIPEATARRILRVLREDGTLKVISDGRGHRSAVLAFPELLNLMERKSFEDH